MSRRSTTRIRGARVAGLAIALTALFAGVAAPGAQAGPLVASAEKCAAHSYEQPFRPWLDLADYVLLPGGTFEGGSSSDWSMDGANVVQGNEPYYVHGAGETKALAIGSGKSATSGTMCVGLNEPTLRLFVRSSSASLLSKLKVEVLFEDALGNVNALPIGAAPALTSTSWTPHLPMLVTANLLALIGDQTPVRFRFTAQGSANWTIDDVYVDPRRQ
jgi:hypothetical protein